MTRTNPSSAVGPLVGLKVLEVGGVGPAPFCAMLLADLGAEVIRIDRKESSESGLPVERRFEPLFRGRRSLALDLKKDSAKEVIRRLSRDCDVLIEGFRPGVMERLELGPDVLMKINPRLVYGRMTGWGQTGPLAQAPGHDINYIALTGALHAIGDQNGPPQVPLNLVGDFGGGSMFLALGILSALFESRFSGKGQVVDAGMIDGATSLMTMTYGLLASGYWKDERGVNRLDSGAPWYGVYETSDGLHVAIGSNEARFYKATVALLGLSVEALPDQHDQAGWPAMKAAFTQAFRSKTRNQWCAIFEGTDTCLSPVLSMSEAMRHPHQIARGNFVECDGVMQPAPAPRFSRTPPAIQRPPAKVGEHNEEILVQWGFDQNEITQLRNSGAI